jgi:hypothetical protein
VRARQACSLEPAQESKMRAHLFGALGALLLAGSSPAESLVVGGVPGTMVLERKADGSVLVNWSMTGTQGWMAFGLGTQMNGAKVVGGTPESVKEYQISGKVLSGIKPTGCGLSIKDASYGFESGNTILRFTSKKICKKPFPLTPYNSTSFSIVWAAKNTPNWGKHDQAGVTTVKLPWCGAIKGMGAAAKCNSKTDGQCEWKNGKCVAATVPT